jgi:hypothetical protein
MSALRRSGIVALDDQFLILDEYRRLTSLEGQPGVGYAFLRYLYDNLYNDAGCRLVTITATENDSFAEFPVDERLAKLGTTGSSSPLRSVASRPRRFSTQPTPTGGTIA